VLVHRIAVAEVLQGLTLGAVIVDSAIQLRGAARTSSASVPDKLGNAYHADHKRWGSYPLGTDALQQGVSADGLRSALTVRPRLAANSGTETISYGAFGLVTWLFREHLTLGYHGLIPNAGFTQLSGFCVDEREPFFSNTLHAELYSDRLFSLAMAVANTRAKVNMGLAPHLSVAYRPHKRLRLTATVHAPQRVEFNVKFKFLLATGIERTSSIRFVHDYMPWQIGLGGSLDVLQRTRSTVTLHVSALYGRWSLYVDRHGERPSASYPFSDTMTIAASARYCLGPLLGARLAVQTHTRAGTNGPLQLRGQRPHRRKPQRGIRRFAGASHRRSAR